MPILKFALVVFARSSDVLTTLCQWDFLVKSYAQIKCWCDIPIVITM